MSTPGSKIVEAALAARTRNEAEAVQQLIADAIGARHERPVGNTWNNQGILTASGSKYDHKIIELVTNMQDAVIESLALKKYGSKDQVPFGTPHDAAKGLLAGVEERQQALLSCVTIDNCGTRTDKKKVTITMRDRGCGITPTEIPKGIFRVGAKNKDGVDWQQGTFGLGGATTYCNADAIVLVTRRDPDLLKPGEEDRVSVAVVEWKRERTTRNASYLVESPWSDDDDLGARLAIPYSVPASEVPEFEPGTQITLIGYNTAGLGVISSDERSFASVLSTRLFRPVIPTSFCNNITRSERGAETLYGLERRLDNNPGPEGTEGHDTLPFNHKGNTYHLPIRYRIFSKPGEAGERKKFIASGHALVVTSNGQVHSHWSSDEFKLKTQLKRLSKRIFVVMAVDELPIEIRTEMFTADRQNFVDRPTALKLESELISFLNDWHDLTDANNAIIREEIKGTHHDRPTLAIAEKISRALQVKGFSIGDGTGGGRDTGNSRRPPRPEDQSNLFDDPTAFSGPEHVTAHPGRAKGIYFKLNARDGFLGAESRATLSVTCDHPDIAADEITVGQLRGGRVRVSIAIPENADLGLFKLSASVSEWMKTSGGLGESFHTTTKLEVCEEENRPTPPPSGDTGARGKKGPAPGGLPALLWQSSEGEQPREGWTKTTVGEIEDIPGTDLAEARTEYRELLADVPDLIPTIILNAEYTHLKSYVQARIKDLEDADGVRDRYAVGVGVALMMLNDEEAKAEKAGRQLDEELLLASREASARAVLAVMPDYDKLAKAIED